MKKESLSGVAGSQRVCLHRVLMVSWLDILYDLRLTREKTGDWFLCLPLPLSHHYPRTTPLSIVPLLPLTPRRGRLWPLTQVSAPS